VLGRHNLAYSGPFTLDLLPAEEEDDGVVVHGPLLSSVPSYDGIFLERRVKVLGKEWLRLTIERKDGGRNHVLWRRFGS